MLKYNSRILIVDDNKSIYDDMVKILCTSNSATLEELGSLEKSLFGHEEKTLEEARPKYSLDHASQGKEAYAKVCDAEENNNPYALIFMDVRMPPGWDGIETIYKIWEKHAQIEMVICTAFSDYSWDGILDKLGETDRLLFLKKPFDSVSVQQMASTLVKKWNDGNRARLYIAELEDEIKGRSNQLERLLGELEIKKTA